MKLRFGSGINTLLDLLFSYNKDKAVESYIKDVFDRHVAPNSYDEKVEIMRQFIASFGHQLSSSIQRERPERYAHDYVNLIRAYNQSLQNSSSMFRRL